MDTQASNVPNVSSVGRRPAQQPVLFFLCLLFLGFAFYSARQDRLGSVEKVSRSSFNARGSQESVIDVSANSSHLVARDDYTCSKDQPCKTKACCGGFFGGTKGTCGFGPNFCGKDCVSNCEAKSECGKNASPPGKKCPLNVCCSEFGFCGTTKEFCSKGCQSGCEKVKVPDGKADEPLKKTIGYYEAWSARWKCDSFQPQNIPVTGLTHVNFAFAGIEPGSFELTTMNEKTPESLFSETADVRMMQSGNLDLKVFVSVGGWAFSDNGTETQAVFGEIAKTEDNRQKFAKNVVSFMTQYGFDGVDIDWEYPGAPDRGGKPEDTANLVALMKTLRDTFDKSGKGKYGLTFTVPTSYWYLRWFDVPGMLKYADWVNVMSYDLHGAWDMDNPIGNIVQGHTNLTEIKLAMELLWRNDVQPKQVVIGFGFYGRSFELESPGCSKTGCAFKGPAAPGKCTNGPGTLGFFEIQDIIADQKPDIIHDKEAAVNYFSYAHAKSHQKRSDGTLEIRDDDKNQWVSFDDENTIKQKVDWAKDLGLGGSMAWSVDQDDKKFTSMQALLGHELPDSQDNSPVTDVGHWASMNGQNCKLTDCAKGNDLKCDVGWALAPNGGQIAADCKGGAQRIVCCPIDSMPSNCQWRGGERGATCHGQCHPGESTLFHTNHATRNCLKPGMQAFCCEATSFQAQIDACYWTDCKYDAENRPAKDKQTTCRDGDVKVIDKFGQCPNTVDPIHTIQPPKDASRVDFCCPKASAFANCHWVGKGTCDDNECSATDVMAAMDDYGGDERRCANGLNDRRKALCCNPPKNLNPFLPASLDKLFPITPPKDLFPTFDLSLTDGNKGPFNDANNRPFGFLVLDGPPDALHSLRKRDGSHWHILSCEDLDESGGTLRILCMNDAIDSNCDKVRNGGIEGTVLAIPEGCGPGDYAVAHSIQPSLSQAIQPLVKRSAPEGAIVYDVEISYDFSLVKRDAGDIYIRFDYSNLPSYWESIVKADPHTRDKRGLDKRFWSENIDDWKSKIGTEEGSHSLRATTPQPAYDLPGMDVLLFGVEKKDECKNDDGFLNVRLKGDANCILRFGFTFVGTLAPTFHLEEAFGFFDSKFDHNGRLEFDGKGRVNMHGDEFKKKSVLGQPMGGYYYSHPGIISIGPSFDISASAYGEGELDGKFSLDFAGGNGATFTSFSQPKSLVDKQGGDGGPGNQLPEDSFKGELTAQIDSKGKRKSKRGNDKSGIAKSDATIFALAFFYEAMMQIDISKYGLKSDNANISFKHSTDGYIRLEDNNGKVKVTQSNLEATYEYDRIGEDIPGWEESTDTVIVGERGQVFVAYDDNKPPAKRDAPKDNDKPVFAIDNAIECSDFTAVCPPINRLLSNADPSLYDDPEASDFNDEDASSLQKRHGEPRTFTVRTPTGTFTIRSHGYPNGNSGRDLLAANPDAGHYNAEDAEDCENIEVTDDATTPGTNYVTEHILELNYFPAFLQFAILGYQNNSDGTQYHAQHPAINEAILNPQGGAFWLNYNHWGQNFATAQEGTPGDRIWDIFGSDNNPRVLVNYEAGLNGLKSRVFRGLNPMADRTWHSNRYDQAGTNPGQINAGYAAVTYLNTVMMQFSYMNGAHIHEILSDAVSEIYEELLLFQQRYNIAHGTNIDLASLHTDFLHGVVVARINRARDWLLQRTEALEAIWRPVADQNPNNGDVREIRRLIRTRRDQAGAMQLDQAGFPT